MTETSVPSPCVRNCCLNEQDVCLGCYRTLEEILQWQASSDKEKLAVIDKCAERKLAKDSGKMK